MPFYGKAHIAYAPVDRVVGLSKLARLVDAFAHRLQTQEHLTAQVAGAINATPAARRRGGDGSRAHLHVGARHCEERCLPLPAALPGFSMIIRKSRPVSSIWSVAYKVYREGMTPSR